MGSLMAGWNSPRSKKKFNRTLSLTREEIDHYWRNKKVDQGQEEVSTPSSPLRNKEEVSSPPSPFGVKKTMQKSSTFSAPEDEEPGFERAAFLPSPHKEILKSRTFNGRKAEVELESERLVGSASAPPAAWWTKTDLAFLNERPVLEVVEGHSKFKYASQYDITGRVKVDESSSSSTVVF